MWAARPAGAVAAPLQPAGKLVLPSTGLCVSQFSRPVITIVNISSRTPRHRDSKSSCKVRWERASAELGGGGGGTAAPGPPEPAPPARDPAPARGPEPVLHPQPCASPASPAPRTRSRSLDADRPGWGRDCSPRHGWELPPEPSVHTAALPGPAEPVLCEGKGTGASWAWGGRRGRPVALPWARILPLVL